MPIFLFRPLLLFLGLILVTPTFSQQVTRLGIEELQRTGLQANGLVMAARSQVDMAKAGVVTASAFLNPEVTVTAGPDSNRYPLIVTGPTSMQRSVTVNQAIENPFMRSARINASEAAVEASRAGFDQVRADLAAQGEKPVRNVPVRASAAVGTGTLTSKAYDGLKELLFFWL